MRNKNGELTTTQLVTIIILIASFAVILFFIFRLNLGETTDREICRNSVITRGSSVLPAESVPLKCQRSYLCLTEDGSCETLTNPIKEKVKTKEEVYKILAEEMATCWWMFGQGEVNYVGADFKAKHYCSICTQVAFDDSAKPIFETGEIDEAYFYNTYLTTHNISGKGTTYSEYLYGTNDFSLIHSGGFKKISLDKTYYIMMGIISEKSTFKRVLVGIGVGVGITAVALLTPITGGLSLVSTTGILIATGGAASGGILVGVTGEGPTGNKFLKPAIIEFNSQEFKDLGCDSITTLS